MEKIKFKNGFITPYDIWFLERTTDFHERKLLLGKTKKNKTVVSLIEKRIIDSKVFIDTQCGSKAERIIHIERNRILYTRQEVLLSKKGKPYGWVYGENLEIRDKKGKVTAIKQQACDYFGQKEVIKIIKD